MKVKVKDWLIHKLGGKTKDDLFYEPLPLVSYKQTDIITYEMYMVIDNYRAPSQEEIQARLAFKFLDAVEKNMEVRCDELPERGKRQYQAILKIVKSS